MGAEEIAAIQKRIDDANNLNNELVQATQSIDAVGKEAEAELIEAFWPIMQSEVRYLRDLLNLNQPVVSLCSCVAVEPWVTLCWNNLNDDWRPRVEIEDILRKVFQFPGTDVFFHWCIPDPSRKLSFSWEWRYDNGLDPYRKKFHRFAVRVDLQHTPDLRGWLSDHDLYVNWSRVDCCDGGSKAFRELELETVEENRKSRHKLGFFNLVRASQQNDTVKSTTPP